MGRPARRRGFPDGTGRPGQREVSSLPECGRFRAHHRCGLGTTFIDYNCYRLTVFDPSYGAGDHFAGQDDRSTKDRKVALPAYEREAAEHPGAACGAAELAGAAVAVPFVSAFAAALAVAQAIRICSGSSHVLNVVGRLDGLTVPKAVGSTATPSRVIGCAITGDGPRALPASR